MLKRLFWTISRQENQFVDFTNGDYKLKNMVDYSKLAWKYCQVHENFILIDFFSNHQNLF